MKDKTYSKWDTVMTFFYIVLIIGNVALVTKGRGSAVTACLFSLLLGMNLQRHFTKKVIDKKQVK